MRVRLALTLCLLFASLSSAFATGPTNPPIQWYSQGTFVVAGVPPDFQGSGIACVFNATTGRFECQVSAPVAGTANALSADGTDCAVGSAARGIDVIGNGTGCFAVASQAALDAQVATEAAHEAATIAHGATATPTADRIPIAGGVGTLAGGWLPLPTSSTRGAVLTSNPCNATTGKVIGIKTNGEVDCGTDQGGGTASTITLTPGGSISSTDVQAGIFELRDEKQPLSSKLTDLANLVCVNGVAQYVSSVLTCGAGGGVSSFNSRTGAVVPAPGDYTAGQTTLTPGGSIAATDVQAAVFELRDEKQPLDADLTTIASLVCVDGEIIKKASGAWGCGIDNSSGGGGLGDPGANGIIKRTALNTTTPAIAGTDYTLPSTLSTPGTINQSGNPVDWSQLKNVPAGFADGTDAGGGGGQTLQDVVVLGRSVTDAVDVGSAVRIGGLTNYFLIYGNDTEGAMLTANPAQALNWKASSALSIGILNSAGVDIARFDEATKKTTLSGQLALSNLGVTFTASDTNLTCSAGVYGVYADLSETKLKKCTNGTATDLDTGAGSGDALTTNPLSQFAATTSAQLAGVLTDEKGSSGGFARIDGTLVVAPGKTGTINNTLTFAGTDATTVTFQGTDTYVGRTTTDTLTNKTFVTPILGVATATSLGIGTGVTPPLTAFHLAETTAATPRGIMNSQHSNTTNSAQFNLYKSRGTFAAPTTIVTGDVLGNILFAGHDGANYLMMGGIRVTSTGTIAATRVPTLMEFRTATNATPSVMTTALTLNADQTATFAGVVTAPSFSATGTTAGNLALCDDAGTHCITLASPASRATDLKFVLPTADPTAGQIMSWSAPASGVTTGTWVTAGLSVTCSPLPTSVTFTKGLVTSVTGGTCS